MPSTTTHGTQDEEMKGVAEGLKASIEEAQALSQRLLRVRQAISQRLASEPHPLDPNRISVTRETNIRALLALEEQERWALWCELAENVSYPDPESAPTLLVTYPCSFPTGKKLVIAWPKDEPEMEDAERKTSIAWLAELEEYELRALSEYASECVYGKRDRPIPTPTLIRSRIYSNGESVTLLDDGGRELWPQVGSVDRTGIVTQVANGREVRDEKLDEWRRAVSEMLT